MDPGRRREWLEADGRGGFASGTEVLGLRTRRYHALLLAATRPPTGRMLLVNGFEAHVITPRGRFALTTQAYAPDVLHPDGHTRITDFTASPWPRWQLTLEDGTLIEHELFAVHGEATVVLRFRVLTALPARDALMLELRPLLSGRDYHALHHENPGFTFESEQRGEQVRWHAYQSVPDVWSLANAEYELAPDWYRNFIYSEEQARGLDHIEDLATPGILRFDLAQHSAAWILSTNSFATKAHAPDVAEALAARELTRRGALPRSLERAAAAYLVQRGTGLSIVAGYPWFTDWGRDTFIALRGLCIAAGRLAEARHILIAWAALVSRGMLPNRFPDRSDEPEYNSVDASLWYIIAVHDLLRAADGGTHVVSADDRMTLQAAASAILTGYAQGTRFGIRCDADGLLAAGEPGTQLTWMDAKVGDWVVTPRIGKPVEIQALWLNALAIASHWSAEWQPLYERGLAAFRARFWNDDAGMLFDVVDDNHELGHCDASVRPNQVLAIGGLPLCLLEPERARRVLDAVEMQLLTPLGLRTLAASDPAYTPRYEGGVLERDRSYHQGTVWPWLLGPFVEAWVRVRDDTRSARRQAHERFVAPVLAYVAEQGSGHLCEIADGDAPHTARGCPFQAWSLGELMRLELDVLADSD